MTKPTDRGFITDAYPSGWFQLGWSHNFTSGAVIPSRIFGRDIVIYRNEEGSLRVADAYCPHFGAHLGHGGEVRENCLVCPFHGWRYDDKGKHVATPHSRRERTAKQLRLWPVAEASGIAFIWHDENGVSPQWEYPKSIEDEDAYFPLQSRCWEWNLLPNFVTENAVDASHFGFIHHAAVIPELTAISTEGPVFRNELVWPQLAAGKLENQLFGVGLSHSRFSGIFRGIDEGVSLVAVTPIEDDRATYFMTNWVRRSAGDSREVPPSVVKFCEEQFVQAERDRPIWEHMRYETRPPVTPEEKEPYHTLRSWARRFYPGQPEYTDFVCAS